MTDDFFDPATCRWSSLMMPIISIVFPLPASPFIQSSSICLSSRHPRVIENPAEGVAQQAALGPLDPNLLVAGVGQQ